ncbi:thioredoxin family protein [Pseudozobellia sp. WGM2]|uniref:DUF1223 domain-containing protein n=1 Tax=Pseudozobellia sp. WGM2 TaxID=2787625 RepID=UPI001AE08ACA|nr:DUF1223 domain-containing protein [Pseudozobellia sp. WGM2]
MTFSKAKYINIVFLMIVIFAAISFFSFSSVIDKNSIDNTPDEPYAPIVVLELFTSQGCSSCPPADKLLDKVKARNEENLFTLSYHVDYWDYIGWEDPFANPAFTEKQKYYNRKFSSKRIYTPQLVVNGDSHFVGSNVSDMNNAIIKYGASKVENSVVLKNVEASSNMISFDYLVHGALTGKQLKAVLVLDERVTNVKRGENRNRKLVNSNIVVTEKYKENLGSTGRLSISIPSLVKRGEKLQLIVLVENEEYKITGAAQSGLIDKS